MQGLQTDPAITPLIEALSRAGLELREARTRPAPLVIWFLATPSPPRAVEAARRQLGPRPAELGLRLPEPLRQLAAALPANGQAPQGGLADAPAAYAQEVRSFRALRKRAQNAGHRNRLRARFLEAGPEAVPDYELLELLLFFSIDIADTKPLAKELLARYGSLGAILKAEPTALAELGDLQRKDPEIDGYLAYRLSDDFALDQDAGPDDLSAAGRQMRAWKRPRRPIPARRRIGIGKRSGSGAGARP